MRRASGFVAAVILALGVLSVTESASYGHPGRTAADGCHYCRTNCSSWGEAWNVRHCHGAPAMRFDPPDFDRPESRPPGRPAAGPAIVACQQLGLGSSGRVGPLGCRQVAVRQPL